MSAGQRPTKRDDHPLTAHLQIEMPNGKPFVPKIIVHLGLGGLRTRRPKWIARWGGWFVYDGGWMELSEDRSIGWQTKEHAKRRADARERVDAVLAKATGQEGGAL